MDSNMYVKKCCSSKTPILRPIPVFHRGLHDPLHGQAVLREAEPEAVVRLKPYIANRTLQNSYLCSLQNAVNMVLDLLNYSCAILSDFSKACAELGSW